MIIYIDETGVARNLASNKRVLGVPRAIHDAARRERAHIERTTSRRTGKPVYTLLAKTKPPTEKPRDLVMSDLHWRYLLRSVAKGKNTLLTGPAGAGKTLAIQSLAAAHADRPFFPFNLGATQDARSTLIGNTHFHKSSGTVVTPALFVQAIQTPHALILLDELTRGSHDSWNILMPVLDVNQRYLRIDEAPDSPTIRVAEGVTFLATANIGLAYTATRTLDRGLFDRFAVILDMQYLSQPEEYDLVLRKFPILGSTPTLTYAAAALTKIAQETRNHAFGDSGKLSLALSTRTVVEAAELLADGFTLGEVAEVALYPFYSSAGQLNSERTFMKQLVQYHLK
jgi:MoxR-like ATPase